MMKPFDKENVKGKQSSGHMVLDIRWCPFCIWVYLTQTGDTVWKALHCLSSLSRKLLATGEIAWYGPQVSTYPVNVHLHTVPPSVFKGCVGGLGYVKKKKKKYSQSKINTRSTRQHWINLFLAGILFHVVSSLFIASPSVTPLSCLSLMVHSMVVFTVVMAIYAVVLFIQSIPLSAQLVWKYSLFVSL